MSRVPTPGGDANNWGTVLNDYLQQALGSDGTLVTTATNPFTGIANTNLAGLSKPGIVQLSGDIGNTAYSPRVIGLYGRSVDSAAPINGDVLTWSTATSKWTPIATGAGGGGLVGDIDGGSASSSYGGLTSVDGGTS